MVKIDNSAIEDQKNKGNESIAEITEIEEENLPERGYSQFSKDLSSQSDSVNQEEAFGNISMTVINDQPSSWASPSSIQLPYNDISSVDRKITTTLKPKDGRGCISKEDIGLFYESLRFACSMIPKLKDDPHFKDFLKENKPSLKSIQVLWKKSPMFREGLTKGQGVNQNIENYLEKGQGVNQNIQNYLEQRKSKRKVTVLCKDLYKILRFTLEKLKKEELTNKSKLISLSKTVEFRIIKEDVSDLKELEEKEEEKDTK